MRGQSRYFHADGSRPSCRGAELCRKAGIKRWRLTALAEVIVDECVRGRIVNILGFGKFWVKDVPEYRRPVRNPITGMTRISLVPGRYRLMFRPTPALRAQLVLRRLGRAAGTDRPSPASVREPVEERA